MKGDMNKRDSSEDVDGAIPLGFLSPQDVQMEYWPAGNRTRAVTVVRALAVLFVLQQSVAKLYLLSRRPTYWFSMRKLEHEDIEYAFVGVLSAINSLVILLLGNAWTAWRSNNNAGETSQCTSHHDPASINSHILSSLTLLTVLGFWSALSMSLVYVQPSTMFSNELSATVIAIFSWIFVEVLRKLLFPGVRVVEVGIPVVICVLAFIARWQVVGRALMNIGSGNTNWYMVY